MNLIITTKINNFASQREDLKAEKVTLVEKQLTEIPSPLFQNSDLKSLDISHNNLTIVPDEIGTLKELKVLNVSYNSIEVVSKIFIDSIQFKIQHQPGKISPTFNFS